MSISNFTIENKGYGDWKVSIKHGAFDHGIHGGAKIVIAWLENVATMASAGRIPRQVFGFADYAHGFIKKEEKL